MILDNEVMTTGWYTAVMILCRATGAVLFVPGHPGPCRKMVYRPGHVPRSTSFYFITSFGGKIKSD